MTVPNKFISQLNAIEKTDQKENVRKPNKFLDQVEGLDLSPKEGIGKSTARSILQVPLGLAKASPVSYGADLAKLFTEGSSQEILRDLAENDPDLVMNIANQAREEALKYFPTQGLAEELIEKNTGIPLEAKNKTQKAIRLGASGAAFRPGGLTSKATGAVIAPSASLGLQQAGVPEPIADALGLGISGLAPQAQISPKVKTSGLKERGFEKLKKDTTVSSSRYDSIKNAVEKDFREISEGMLDKNRTYSAMKDDALFKEKIGDLFGEVEKLAEEIPGNIHTETVRDAFKKRVRNRETKGISPDEFEKSLNRESRKILKDIPFDELTAPQVVEQFRKNNKSLKELYEPGKSGAQNRAKKEAILDYNRSLEDVISKKYPDSEFKELFEFTNKRWAEINDIEQIDTFVNDLFDGKINYGKAKQIFSRDKEHVSRPFKRILGEEGFKDFKQLTEDLLSTQKGMSYIKKAKDAGFSDLAKTAVHYIISPKTAIGQKAIQYSKKAYQTLLDKPKIAITWKNALQDLKSGNYKQAEKEFNELQKSINQANPSSQK